MKKLITFFEYYNCKSGISIFTWMVNWKIMLTVSLKQEKAENFILFIIQRIRGLSLAMNKDVCDWLRQTLNPSVLEGERPIKDRADTHL